MSTEPQAERSSRLSVAGLSGLAPPRRQSARPLRQRSYWMVVAAATVLRPEFGSTFTRGAERLLGTVGGVAIAGLITVGVNPGPAATVALVGSLAWAAYSLFPASFAVGFAFITTMVVFLLDVVSPDTLATGGDRLVDTLVGGAIGLAAYLVWPTWSGTSARDSLAAVVDAQAAYEHAVLSCLVQGAAAADGSIRPLARGARLARTRADAAVSHSLDDPATRRLQADRAQAILAALRRHVEAIHVLRLDARGRAPLPQLEPFVARVEEVLAGIATILRSDAPWPPQVPAMAGLRARYDRFAASRESDGGESGAGGVLLGELDEIVDAVDALAALVGFRETGEITGLAGGPTIGGEPSQEGSPHP